MQHRSEYSRKRLLKMNVQDLVHPNDQEKSKQYFNKLIRDGYYEMFEGIESHLRDPLYGTYYNSFNSTSMVYKETKSVKWTVVASILPLIMGFVICFIVAQLWRVFA